MKKIASNIILYAAIVGCVSCKYCVECECTKDGVVTEEKTCGRGNDKSGAARNFSNHLKKTKDYDECVCRY